MKIRILAGIHVAVAIVIIALGCSSDSSPASLAALSPTPAQIESTQVVPATKTPEPPATPFANIFCGQEMPEMDSDGLVLAQQDMPEGFYLSEQPPWDNRAVARTRFDPDKWLKDYETWGRLDGSKVSFTNGTLDNVIQSEASVYRTCDGAFDAFQATVKTFEERLRTEFDEQGLEVNVFEEIKDSSIADESTMWHARVSGIYLGSSIVMDWVGLAFRKSNVTASVTWTSFNENVFRSDVVELAQTMAASIAPAQRSR